MYIQTNIFMYLNYTEMYLKIRKCANNLSYFENLVFDGVY